MNSNEFLLLTHQFISNKNITKCEIYIAMKRIVHKEQSQKSPRRTAVGCETVSGKILCVNYGTGLGAPYNLKYGVFPALSEEERAVAQAFWAQC